MTPVARFCTLGVVLRTRLRRSAPSWIFAACALALTPGVARAQTPGLETVGPAPIVRVIVGEGNVTVKTWDRQAVAVDDPTGVNVRQFSVNSTEAQSTIPILAGRIGSPDGPVDLPAETFAVSTLAPGPHDVVAVRGSEANVTVTVPQNAALVQVQMGKGNVSLQDYHGGTFVARVRNGTARLTNDGGDAFVQVMRGQVIADNANFARVRVRSAVANVLFTNSRSQQIEVSSVRGSIAYDGGSFEPGLARFETQSGDVALGVNGNAELAAHASGSGHVLTSFDPGAQISGREGEQRAVLGGGGPVVNATSGTGNVYLYNGQIASRHVGAEWQPMRTTVAQQRGGRVVPAVESSHVERPAQTEHSAQTERQVQAEHQATHAAPADTQNRYPISPAFKRFAAPPAPANVRPRALPPPQQKTPPRAAASPQLRRNGQPRQHDRRPPR
jgi:outer membrane protein assembly factor BamB